MPQPYDEAKNLAAKNRIVSDGAEKDGPEEDRRRSARFICGGEAKISRLPSDGIFLPGKILDLSLHGCRVDTESPIDHGARAEILLRINSTTFRAVGEVRTIRDSSDAGIEFIQLSSNGRDSLADLIKELARVQAAMNQLKSVRAEANANLFKRQLEEGRVRAGRLSERFAGLGTALSLSNKNSGESRESNQRIASDESKVEEPRPLVISVDFLG